MFFRKSSIPTVCLLIGCAVFAGAGDIASFADLGFSPNGAVYMFAQYGLQHDTLRPWAELFAVDVAKNDFLPGGQLSYTHDQPAVPGQDGSGALYRLIGRHTALAERHGVTFLQQGKPLYIALEERDCSSGQIIEFRDFEQSVSYTASLAAVSEGGGDKQTSSFHISLERGAKDGSKKSYTAGSPQIKRPLISAYRIWQVFAAPQNKGLVFVIEMKKTVPGGFDIRYMVETLAL
jgi:predicted secreted protein